MLVVRLMDFSSLRWKNSILKTLLLRAFNEAELLSRFRFDIAFIQGSQLSLMVIVSFERWAML